MLWRVSLSLTSKGNVGKKGTLAPSPEMMI
jgi:hypothetical protein